MKIKRKEKVSIMTGKKVASILLASLIVMSFSMLFNTAMAQEYPPLSELAVKVPEVGKVDIYFTTYELWDVNGIDIEMNYNPAAMDVVNVNVDPDGWFAAFWDGGIMVLYLNASYLPGGIPGYMRVAFIGIPGPGGSHVAPNGQGRLLSLDTTVVDMGLAEIELKNPDPRPSISPWGPEDFPCDIAGFPHSERWYPPWNSLKKAPAIPHVVTVQSIGAFFTESTHNPKPNEVIYLDASGSFSEAGIARYEWDFDSDGVFDDATGVTASTYYATFGFYKITLKVTDNGGMTAYTSSIKMVNVLQNAEAEHRIFKVLSDEDQLNTLTATARNYGDVSAKVMAKFTTIDSESQAELGSELSPPAILMPGTRIDLSVNWNPYIYWIPGTTARYDVRVELSFDDGHTWITAETFKLGFRVTD